MRAIQHWELIENLRVVLIKPTCYGPDGFAERFRLNFMPNSTLCYLDSMTPRQIGSTRIDVTLVDETGRTDLDYLKLFNSPDRRTRVLVALAGVQSHQFPRALDLAALAGEEGALTIIGGPHAMTCDTSLFHNRGTSFSLAEADLVWRTILEDAIAGELQPVYGRGERWQMDLSHAPVIKPPPARGLKGYFLQMLGIYPVRGCPYGCDFCSVIEIAGRRLRAEPIETTMQSLRNAKKAGIPLLFFTSDNFNKYPLAPQLLQAMIDEKIGIPFLVQCDTQILHQEELVSLLGRAGCYVMFVGFESLNAASLTTLNKAHNLGEGQMDTLEKYRRIVRQNRASGIRSVFASIIGLMEDTRESILEHIRILKDDVRPDDIAAYILTPFPGTKQYESFRDAGLIWQTNLDYYNSAYPTWHHPNLSNNDLSELLFRFYRDFNDWPALAGAMGGIMRDRAFTNNDFVLRFGYKAFSRYAVWQKVHPQAAGLGRVRRDHKNDYLPLRQRVFGITLAPLPENLRHAAPSRQKVVCSLPSREERFSLYAP
jgi:hypothetical protein